MAVDKLTILAAVAASGILAGLEGCGGAEPHAGDPPAKTEKHACGGKPGEAHACGAHQEGPEAVDGGATPAAPQ